MALRGSRARATRSRDARPPSRRAHARRRRFLGSRRLLLARLLAAAPPPAAWCRLPRGWGVVFWGALFPSFPRAAASQSGNPRARLLTTACCRTHPSRVCWPRAPKCQSTCQSARRDAGLLVGLLVGLSICLATTPRSQLLLRPRLCAKSSRGCRTPHTGLHVIHQQIFIGCQPCISSLCWSALSELHSTGKDCRYSSQHK